MPRYDPVGDLNALWAEYEDDPVFAHLRLPGINLVPGSGPADSDIMLVGEAPGATENGLRRPFSGSSGRLLDQLILLAGYRRESVYVTNVLKYRPPGNRTPTQPEIDAGRHYLRQEWAILRPNLVVAVGRVARLALLGNDKTTARAHLVTFGHGWLCHQYHPAYGLRGGPKVQKMMEREWKEMGDEFRSRR